MFSNICPAAYERPYTASSLSPATYNGPRVISILSPATSDGPYATAHATSGELSTALSRDCTVDPNNRIVLNRSATPMTSKKATS